MEDDHPFLGLRVDGFDDGVDTGGSFPGIFPFTVAEFHPPFAVFDLEFGREAVFTVLAILSVHTVFSVFSVFTVLPVDAVLTVLAVLSVNAVAAILAVPAVHTVHAVGADFLAVHQEPAAVEGPVVIPVLIHADAYGRRFAVPAVLAVLAVVHLVFLGLAVPVHQDDLVSLGIVGGHHTLDKVLVAEEFRNEGDLLVQQLQPVLQRSDAAVQFGEFGIHLIQPLAAREEQGSQREETNQFFHKYLFLFYLQLI